MAHCSIGVPCARCLRMSTREGFTLGAHSKPRTCLLLSLFCPSVVTRSQTLDRWLQLCLLRLQMPNVTTQPNTKCRDCPLWVFDWMPEHLAMCRKGQAASRVFGKSTFDAVEGAPLTAGSCQAMAVSQLVMIFDHEGSSRRVSFHGSKRLHQVRLLSYLHSSVPSQSLPCTGWLPQICHNL